MATMRAARAISALVRTMPSPEAGARERLTWLDLKTRVFEEIAAEHALVVADATSYANSAREEARALRDALEKETPS